MPLSFDALLKKQSETNSPDILLVTGQPPCIRSRSGAVEPQSEDLVTGADVEQILLQLAGEGGLSKFEKAKEFECSFEREGVGRWRATFFETSEGPGLACRLIPFAIPTPDQIGIPEEIQKLALKSDGLILITGPNGHGKSTTLASLVDLINSKREAHIVTIEDPIEFTYQRKKSIISQRGVGTDTLSFPTAIRHSLRQSVDVVVIGELRDLETIQTAMTLAETGHLVLATLHTHDAPRTVQRIVDVFPADQQAQIALQFSHSLSAIMSQRLVKAANGKDRVCVREILINNDGTAHAIRTRKISELYSQIQINREAGMISFDDSLLELAESGEIDAKTALHESHDPKHFAKQLKERGLS